VPAPLQSAAWKNLYLRTEIKCISALLNQSISYGLWGAYRISYAHRFACSSFSLIVSARRLCNIRRSFACLSVCLWAASRRNYGSNIHAYSTRDLSSDKEKMVKFWKSSSSGSRRSEYWKNSAVLFTTATATSLAAVACWSRHCPSHRK